MLRGTAVLKNSLTSCLFNWAPTIELVSSEKITKGDAMLESIFRAEVSGNHLLIALSSRPQPTSLQFFESFTRHLLPEDDTMIVLIREADHMVMRVLERDGTESSMCGNGLLAAALIAKQSGYPMRVRSLYGMITLQADTNLPGAKLALPTHRIHRANAVYSVHGEPHATLNVLSLNVATFSELGIQASPDHNVTLYMYGGPSLLYARTLERGVYRVTGSCGTGACAAVQAATDAGYPLENTVNVQMPGGILTVARVCGGFFLQGNVDLKTVPAI